MKGKYILHIPSGYYFNCAYYPDRDKLCCCVLTEKPVDYRVDDTDIFDRFYYYDRYNTIFKIKLFPNKTLYDSSFKEFTLVEIEIDETKI